MQLWPTHSNLHAPGRCSTCKAVECQDVASPEEHDISGAADGDADPATGQPLGMLLHISGPFTKLPHLPALLPLAVYSDSGRFGTRQLLLLLYGLIHVQGNLTGSQNYLTLHSFQPLVQSPSRLQNGDASLPCDLPVGLVA